MLAGDAGVGAAVGAALSHGGRHGLGFAVEEGIVVELDDLLRERIVDPKADREKAQTAYDHAASQMLPSALTLKRLLRSASS
jgi:hypothetical protein